MVHSMIPEIINKYVILDLSRPKLQTDGWVDVSARGTLEGFGLISQYNIHVQLCIMHSAP